MGRKKQARSSTGATTPSSSTSSSTTKSDTGVRKQQAAAAVAPAATAAAAATRSIVIRGARQHNLKNLSLDLPREQLILFTGLSGSGKSTLAFDTLYAEGQRRYVESLSTYARQFLEQLPKPDVEVIEGLPPTLAVEQRIGQANPRSTVATITEVYDYLRLLYARVGVPHCPTCQAVIERQEVHEIVDRVASYPERTRVLILAPLVRDQPGEHRDTLMRIKREGYLRARIDGEVVEVNKLAKLEQPAKPHTIEAVVDRLVIKPDLGARLPDSLELALKLGEGQLIVSRQEPEATAGGHSADGDVDAADADADADGSGARATASGAELEQVATDLAQMRQARAERGELEEGLPTGLDEIMFELAGGTRSRASVEEVRSAGWIDEKFSELLACPNGHMAIEPLTPRFFSFNSPEGACPRCHGLGTVMEVDTDLCVPDEKAPLKDAVEPWAKAGRRLGSIYKKKLENFAEALEISLETRFKDLSYGARELLLHGGSEAELKRLGLKEWEAVAPNLERRYRETDSEATRTKIMEYMTERRCPECGGARLGPVARAVRIAGIDISEFAALTVEEAQLFAERIRLPKEEAQVAGPVLTQVRNRLRFLHGVGLEYLTLDRRAHTLSGGEAQRIRLATQVGSGLVGCCYVLDEPSIGLHQRDNARLLETLNHLRDIGNSVIVVEHDPDFILAADHVVDLGPGAGHDGGELLYQGDVAGLLECERSVTGGYLSGRLQIEPRAVRRKLNRRAQLQIKGAKQHNLKNIDVDIPLGLFTCVTGVSGSGKSTLISDILLLALKKRLHAAKVKPGKHETILGTSQVDKVIEIDQSPIGKTPRSNPATYTNAFNEIRNAFSMTREAKMRGYSASRFSFNVKGGRCEACQGQGTKRIDMQFLPDMFVTCDVCRGMRFNRETLEIRYKGKTIADVLEMTVSEARQFFYNFPKLEPMLRTLEDVGLPYVRLGQSSNTLSGGEAQRVKLAAELGRPAGTDTHTVYILDEPSTGLHFADVARLLDVLNRLVDAGNTVVVIEHNLDIIKMADYIIDLGPEGGIQGGTVVAEGTPEQVAQNRYSHTGKFLRPLLATD